METKVPPPVPPPLPSLQSTPSALNKRNVLEQALLNPEIEISRACQASWNYITNSNINKYIISIYHQVRPVLQDGPKCGLVALSMASQLVSKTLTVDTIFERAKKLNFTNKGEMFSATQMTDLAKDLLHCDAELIIDLEKQKNKFFDHILLGFPALVPYDADSNHEPCCKRGHTAHWAVVTGFCIVLSEDMHKFLITCQEDINVPHLYHWSSSSFPFDTSGLPVFVFARQGKSTRIQVWNFDQLCESNKNLSEYSVKHTSGDFVLPKNGIQKELSNQAVLLSKC